MRSNQGKGSIYNVIKIINYNLNSRLNTTLTFSTLVPSPMYHIMVENIKSSNL